MFNSKRKGIELMIKIYLKLGYSKKEICRLLEISMDDFIRITTK